MGSYASIGRRFQVSPTFIGDMLNGRKLPSTETGIRIAVDTGVAYEWLMTGRGPIKVEQGGAEGTLRIDHLPHDAQATIKAVVHSFEQSSAAEPSSAGGNGA